MHPNNEYVEYDDYDGGEDEFDYTDCMLMPNGQCMKAGSEECDWECPYRNSEHFAGSRLWHQKHNAGVPVDGCGCRECQEARK